MSKVIFHRTVQKDMDGIYRHYLEESGSKLADRFYDAFMATVNQALANPRHFHPLKQGSIWRRAGIKGFTHHVVYEETAYGIRILVLRHDQRHDSFGLRRK
jgi:plasmid stabilization system protein ParE